MHPNMMTMIMMIMVINIVIVIVIMWYFRRHHDRRNYSHDEYNYGDGDEDGKRDDDSGITFKSDGYGSTVINALFRNNSNNSNNNKNMTTTTNNNRNNLEHISLPFGSTTTSETSTSDDDLREHKVSRSVSPSTPRTSVMDIVKSELMTPATPPSMGSTIKSIQKGTQVFIDTNTPLHGEQARHKT